MFYKIGFDIALYVMLFVALAGMAIFYFRARVELDTLKHEKTYWDKALKILRVNVYLDTLDKRPTPKVKEYRRGYANAVDLLHQILKIPYDPGQVSSDERNEAHNPGGKSV